MPPQQSQVKDVEDAGPDFMQVVFSQPEKGIAVAFNNPQSIAYVIQVSEFEPGTEVLRRSFLADDYRTYARVLQPQQHRHIMEWNQMIQNEAGLKWLRQPDPRRGRRKENRGANCELLAPRFDLTNAHGDDPTSQIRTLPPSVETATNAPERENSRAFGWPAKPDNLPHSSSSGTESSRMHGSVSPHAAAPRRPSGEKATGP